MLECFQRILVRKLRNLLRGKEGGYQKSTLKYWGRGEVGSPKKDYAIFNGPLLFWREKIPPVARGTNWIEGDMCSRTHSHADIWQEVGGTFEENGN